MVNPLRPFILALCLGVLIGSPRRAPGATVSATLTLNAAAVVNTFVPAQAFGVNAAYWDGNALNAVVPQLQALGSRFIRYPGGSSSDDFHWNGSGSFDANHHWVPSDTAYDLSWQDTELYRGTTSQSYNVAANLTDGDASTYWLSNADTDFPGAQWVYVDLGSAKSATSVTVTWGTPYATTFKVQVWNSTAGWPPPFEAPSNLWVDTSAGVVASTGGVQTVTFTATPASRFYRVLCLTSSAAPAQYAIAELTVSNGATQLTANTAAVSASGAPLQSPTCASSTDPACVMGSPVAMDFESFMAWIHGLPFAARPLLTVDFGTGTPQEAAAWVHYANVVRGYGIKDWEIGNELDGNWETGGPLSASDYARRYLEFYQAMKAQDPTIRVYGPVSGDPYAASDDLDGKTYIQGFVDRLASDPGGNKAADLDGVDFHWYPDYNNTPPILGTPADVTGFVQSLGTVLAPLPAPTTIPVLMTEYNGGNASSETTTLSNGLWAADWLGQFLVSLGPRFSGCLWDLLEGDNSDTSPTGFALGLLNGTQDAWLYQPRAAYWALQMLSADWALPGDTRSHTLVGVSGAPALLSAYADLRPDGVLALLVVNNDPANAYAAALDFSGFAPASTAATWTFDAANYAWENTAAPYHAVPDTAPTGGSDAGVASGYIHTFAPSSITVLQFQNSALPPASATPSPAPSATPSASPTPQPFVLVDDFEDPARNGTPPARLNLWDGSWSASSSNTTVSVSYLAPGAAGTLHSLSWTSAVAAGGWSDLVTSLPTVFDAAGQGYVGLEFWAYGDGNKYWAAIQTASVTDYNYYGLAITPPAGRWTFYQIPFSSMARQPGWGSQTPAPPATPAANDLKGIQFGTYGSSPRNYTLGLDQIGFYQASDLGNQNIPPPTPAATATFSPTVPESVTSLAIQRVLAWPMPLTGGGPLKLAVDLVSRVPSLRVQVYNGAYVLLKDLTFSSAGPGWSNVVLPAGVPPTNGLYFARVWAQDNGQSGPAKPVVLYVAR